MEYFALTDIGKFREQNEDFYYADITTGLFAVADGMGGHNAGEVASRLAVESFVNRFDELKRTNIITKKTSDTPAGDGIKPPEPAAGSIYSGKDKIRLLLYSSMDFANTRVYEMSVSNKEYMGMGTTFTCCYIHENSANIVHLGDSRAYLARNGSFELLTEDHTIVGEMYKKGLITYDEMFNHPLRNYLNKVVGTDSRIESDYIKKELKNGDIIVLCSDGLNSMLTDTQIFKIIQKSKTPKTIAEELVKNANQKGGRDNITVITIKIVN